MEELLDQQHKLLMRGSLLHSKIGARKVPKIPEPPRSFAPWDYVLDEMKWMAHEFMEERRHKSVLALVLVTEIRENQRNKLLSIQETLKHTQTQAKILSDAVQQCYITLDDKTRDEDEDVVMDQGPKVANFLVRVIRHLSYSAATTDPPTKDESQAPANADDNALEQGSTCDDTPMVSVQNLLFYDVEDLSKCDSEWKSYCETQNYEDVDIFAPPTVDSLLVDVAVEMWDKERKGYDLLPDAEELMLLKNSQPQEEQSDLPRLMRFQSELHEFSNTPKVARRWQIFQDMYLEKYVCEHGGHWDLVADLMNVNPFTKGGCFSMKECRDRWISLQKQKGRSVDSSYIPQPILNQVARLVTENQARFSQYPLRLEEEKIPIPASIRSDREPMATDQPFQFLITNCTYETNSYFYNYSELNSKYYPEDSPPKFSFLSKPPPPPLRTILSRTEVTPIAKPGAVKDPCDIAKPVAAPRPTPHIRELKDIVQKPGPAKPPGKPQGGHLNTGSTNMSPSAVNLQHSVGRGTPAATRRKADDGDAGQK